MDYLAAKARILIIEDETEMARLLQQALKESGFEVTLIADGRKALPLAPEHDLLLVDVMLPGMNGFDLVTELRQHAFKMPVLFLTARDGIQDRVRGLEIGDDYLVKPFALAELIARIGALLRRARDAQDVLSYADLKLDRRNRQAQRADTWLHLSATEFSVLEIFMLSPEVALPKSAILREVWHDDESRDDNIVEVYISYLRTKMEAMGRSRLLHTVRGTGYILESRET